MIEMETVTPGCHFARVHLMLTEYHIYTDRNALITALLGDLVVLNNLSLYMFRDW